MICHNCRRTIAEKQLRCDHCGYVVKANVRQSPQKSNQKTPNNPNNNVLYRVQQSELTEIKPTGQRQTPASLRPNTVTIEKTIIRKPSPVANETKPVYQHKAIDEDSGFHYSTFEKKTWIFGIGLVLMVLAAGLVFSYWNQPKESIISNAMFVQAEKAHNQKNYTDALRLYNKFIEEFPEHALVSIANEKLSLIHNELTSFNDQDLERNKLVSNLSQRARIAYDKQRYTGPENDNVMLYVRQILGADPNNQKAIWYENKILEYFEEQATRAMKKYRYQDAMKFYEKILTIRPNDELIKHEYNTVSALVTGRRENLRDASGNLAGSSAKNTVSNSKNAMIAARKKAIRIEAKNITAFSSATKREKKAFDTYNNGQYAEANALFDQARKLYEKSIELRNRQLRNIVSDAQNEMTSAKAEAKRVLAHMFAKQEYQKAEAKEKEAEAFNNRRQYFDARVSFRAATDFYKRAAKTANQRKG